MVSFIIPVLNEERLIGEVIGSVRAAMAGDEYEIIVIDNGSKDRSARIAAERGAEVLIRPGVRIGAMRNMGVAASRGETLVFIDSDIFLKAAWRRNIGGALEMMRRDGLVITGSHPGIDDRNPSWLEKYWFKPFVSRERGNYLSSAHFMMPRSLFEGIGGFDEKRETGEDYDLCQRAKARGARVIHDIGLAVYTCGYPKTLKNFFRRERWHGRGDFVSLETMGQSKIALITLWHLFALILAIGLAAASRKPAWLAVLLGAYLLAWSAFALKRTRAVNLSFLFAIMVYAVYFSARACAFLDMRFKKPARVRNASAVNERAGTVVNGSDRYAVLAQKILDP